ncbi:MAG: GNAT family N-acetyltransferase [Leptospiraceae bacterium]|nr:GNAT family N-acetyltransferase [Leptospiraceae bacterium]MCP5499390.1 GNAT family N-acetyltransferase [Leptospiraceae bacterium]
MIKKTSKDGYETIRKLEVKIFPEHPWSLKQIESHHEKNNSYLYYLDYMPIAYILFLENVYEMEVLRFGVLENFRGKGFATKLFADFLKKHPGKDIFLEVSEVNIPAISFYEKYDFEEIGERKNYYTDGSSGILMKRSFNNR